MLQDCIQNNFLKYVHHSYTYLSIYTNKKEYSTCFCRIYIYLLTKYDGTDYAKLHDINNFHFVQPESFLMHISRHLKYKTLIQ